MKSTREKIEGAIFDIESGTPISPILRERHLKGTLKLNPLTIQIETRLSRTTIYKHLEAIESDKKEKPNFPAAPKPKSLKEVVKDLRLDKKQLKYENKELISQNVAFLRAHLELTKSHEKEVSRLKREISGLKSTETKSRSNVVQLPNVFER